MFINICHSLWQEKVSFQVINRKRDIGKSLLSYHSIILKYIRCSQRCCLERRIGVARAIINFINTSTDD